MGAASPAVAGDLASIAMTTIRAAAAKTLSTGVMASRIGVHRGPSGQGGLLKAGLMRPSPPERRTWRVAHVPPGYFPSLRAMSEARISSSLRAFQATRLLAP